MVSAALQLKSLLTPGIAFKNYDMWCNIRFLKLHQGVLGKQLKLRNLLANQSDCCIRLFYQHRVSAHNSEKRHYSEKFGKTCMIRKKMTLCVGVSYRQIHCFIIVIVSATAIL